MSSGAKLAAWIGGGLLALSIVTTNVIVVLKVLGGNQPAPVVPVPSQPLASLVTDATHRATLSAFYRDFADVLKRDDSVVKTTGQFRTAHEKCTTLMLQNSGYPKYPGLAQAVSDRIKAAIGLEDAPLDATKRAALVACLAQISQELGG